MRQNNSHSKCVYESPEVLSRLRHKARQKFIDSTLKENLQVVDASALTVEEEQIMVDYYQAKVAEICRFLKLPSTDVSVTPIAQWLHRRYYLVHSVMQDDPKYVMLACVLVATKCADLHILMSTIIARIPNIAAEPLIHMEFKVLSSLEFRVRMLNPFQALEGLLVLYFRWISDRNLNDGSGNAYDEQVAKECHQSLTWLVASDNILLYSPSLLGCAAMTAHLPDLAEFFQQNLFIACDAIPIPVKPASPSAELVKSIDRRLIQIRRAIVTKSVLV